MRGTLCRRVSLRNTLFILEGVKMSAKTKLMIRRTVWGLIVLIGIPISLLMINAAPTDLVVLDSNCDVEYSEYGDYSTCDVDIKFNKPIDSGYATVAFYGGDDWYLTTETTYFSSIGTVASSTFYKINGHVTGYAVRSYTFTDEATRSLRAIGKGVLMFSLIIGIPFFICAMLCSYKLYRFEDKVIAVYAGYYHHYITVNGVKTDEHNTIMSFTPIYLSCTLEDGTNLRATVSLTNRISLKINDLLYTRTV